MCEYCGCQAIPAIEELTREHDGIVDLIGEVRTARRCGDVGRMIELGRQISVALGPHTVVEEQGLFPALAGEFPEQIAALEGEHRRIEAVLAEGDDGRASADPTWPQRLIEVLTLLRVHILKEQDGVFPAALSILSNAQWELLDSVRRSVNANSL